MTDSRVTLEQGNLHIRTDLERSELLDHLRQWEPWRHEIHFSNGAKTTDLRTMEPFAKRPSKLWQFEPRIPAEAIRGGKALDIGFNAGYHSILLRSKYGMEVTGIDVSERHLQMAEFLRDLAQLDGISFEIGDANFYHRAEYYDLILHLGTLYHLRHPFLSLENAAASLRPGGFLAVETLTFNAQDDGTLCKFFPRGYAGDPSNWWALGIQAVCGMLEACGLSDVQIIKEWTNEKLAATGMSRTTLLASKPTRGEI